MTLMQARLRDALPTVGKPGASRYRPAFSREKVAFRAGPKWPASIFPTHSPWNPAPELRTIVATRRDGRRPGFLQGGSCMARRCASRPFANLQLESLEAREVPATLAALDPSFGTLGKVTASGAPFTGVALQPDGKIVAVAMSNTDFFVARYNPNGTLDTSFDGDGIKTIDFGGTVDQPKGVALVPVTSFSSGVGFNGDIVIVGSTTKTNDVAIAVLNSNGELDTNFN